MRNILEMQSLVSDIDLSDINLIHFNLKDIPSKAIDCGHSICIGVFFVDRKAISDATIRYITLLLMSLEETQDFALQLSLDSWWLWYRITVEANTDMQHELSVKIEQLYGFIQYLYSLVTIVNSPKNKNLFKARITTGGVIP
ncbi:hypothetical protein [Yersinia massiliensis]|uniref:Pathogenicity island chaperone protein SpiC n=1 Tax=Yersinia massiliensis TaxID=419257 RepID=A0ABM6UYD8_9GAMM|nr:hypothetical protein [Yersinia massiliensis]AVX39949.1 hypothetical protein DA391_21220 [Yersinia massiliensis]QKJ10676.1 hypothetical protein HRD68_08040 [Yersinia massiliensis]